MMDQALAFFNRGQFQKSAHAAEEILHHEPLNTEAMQLLALSLCGLGRRGEGLALLEQIVRMTPQDAQAHYNLGVSYQEVGMQADAILAYQNCLRFSPNHTDALWNVGDLFRLNEYFSEAVTCLKKIISLDKHYPDMYHRLAVALHGARQDDEAAECFRKALEDNPSNAALTHWEYSHLLLRKNIFEAGWRSYDQRFAAKFSVVCHEYPQPRWKGEPLKNKTLLIHAEQGLGDEIMFASTIPDLLAEDANIILATQPALVRLFQQSFPKIDVRPHLLGVNPASVDDVNNIDYQIPICSLARYKRSKLAHFENTKPYLRADESLTAGCLDKLKIVAADANKKFKIGVMWGSNPGHGVAWGQRRAQQKSMPVNLLEPLAAVSNNLLFVSLQNNEVGHEAAFAPQLNMIDFRQSLLDLADTAALIANMDLIISVDTSIAHLAGAMGKPVWVPLMERADWRWGEQGDASVWYKHVRLFRQTEQGNWAPVVNELCSALRDVLAAQKPVLQ
jgi:hypothetical protein